MQRGRCRVAVVIRRRRMGVSANVGCRRRLGVRGSRGSGFVWFVPRCRRAFLLRLRSCWIIGAVVRVVRSHQYRAMVGSLRMRREKCASGGAGMNPSRCPVIRRQVLRVLRSNLSRDRSWCVRVRAGGMRRALIAIRSTLMSQRRCRSLRAQSNAGKLTAWGRRALRRWRRHRLTFRSCARKWAGRRCRAFRRLSAKSRRVALRFVRAILLQNRHQRNLRWSGRHRWCLSRRARGRGRARL